MSINYVGYKVNEWIGEYSTCLEKTVQLVQFVQTSPRGDSDSTLSSAESPRLTSSVQQPQYSPPSLTESTLSLKLLP